MNDEKYIVREAKINDSRQVWGIRNHPICRQNFHDTKEIDFKHHNVWFRNQYFSDNDNHCYVLENKDSVVGYCRFDIKNNKYLVSIAIDQDCQGKGLGNELLGRACKMFNARKDVLAEIQKINIPSIKIFEKNNFEKYKEDKGYYYYKLGH